MDKGLLKIIDEIKAAELNLVNLKTQLKNHKPENQLEYIEALENLQKISLVGCIKDLEKSKNQIVKYEEFSKVGTFSYCFINDSLKWSKETYKIYDCPSDYSGSLKDFYLNCLDKSTIDRLPEFFQRFSKCKEEVVINHIIHTPKRTKLITFTSCPLLNEQNEIIGVEGFVKDLTDQTKDKKGLENFFSLSYDLHCIIHVDRYFIKVSPAWIKLLGYTEQELLSQSYLAFVHPDDVDKTSITLEEFQEISRVSTFENRYLTKSGEVVHLSWNSHFDEETQLAYATARNVTKSKIARDELVNDLSSKELLLREIHHRVKNNLQIITSLLSLQADANNQETHLQELYQDSKNRIQSMAAIHEMFYQSEELDKIEVGKYLIKLIGDLGKSFDIQSRSIDFSSDMETVFVSLDTAIPLGLIINEIITNSIKHGADAEGKVNLFVKIKSLEGDKLQITIGDNGINSFDDILNQNVESLGILLINSLVDQIDGEIEQLSKTLGTVYELTFENRIGAKP